MSLRRVPEEHHHIASRLTRVASLGGQLPQVTAEVVKLIEEGIAASGGEVKKLSLGDYLKDLAQGEIAAKVEDLFSLDGVYKVWEEITAKIEEITQAGENVAEFLANHRGRADLFGFLCYIAHGGYCAGHEAGSKETAERLTKLPDTYPISDFEGVLSQINAEVDVATNRYMTAVGPFNNLLDGVKANAEAGPVAQEVVRIAEWAHGIGYKEATQDFGDSLRDQAEGDPVESTVEQIDPGIISKAEIAALEKVEAELQEQHRDAKAIPAKAALKQAIKSVKEMLDALKEDAQPAADAVTE